MRIDFTRNPAGQITARANSNTVYGPASQTFAYDALGRLTGANVGTATTWTLDDATNWNTRTVAGTPTQGVGFVPGRRPWRPVRERLS